tara:strand:+ start:205 stop:825 length:621 start_codon:yes stop_codon:yes gene_type:complete
MNKFLLFFISMAFVLCSENDFLLNFMNEDNNWMYLDEDHDISIYILENDSLPIIKLEKYSDSFENIFEIILNVSNYNNILSDRNIYSQYLHEDSDTVYAYQKVKNLIPFTRDRHIIFKIFMVNENRLDWKLINKNNKLYDRFKNRRNKELYYGAGSWQLSKEDGLVKLVHYFFIDPEVNKVPEIFVNSARKKSVIQVFKDVLNALK